MTAALANNLTIFEGRVDDAPQMVVIDDGEKYAIATDDNRLRDLFTAEGGLVPIIDAIQAKVDAFDLDATTAKGRAEIKSLAHKVTRSKTFLDGIGKDMVAEMKDLPRRIDANRKMLRDRLDQIAEETRQPVGEYEAHTKAITDRLNWLDALPSTLAAASVAEIAAQIAILANMPLTVEEWEGMLDEALAIMPRTLAALDRMRLEKAKAEGEAAELERLRAQAADRDRKDAEAARIAEAQERGRREAEQRAEGERQAALGREAEANRQATLATQQAVESERRRVDAEAWAVKAAIDAKEAAALERRMNEDRLETARLQTVEAERQHYADAAAKEAEEKAAREADKEHSRQINTEVAADLLNTLEDAVKLAGLDISQANCLKLARAVTVAIIKGQVRHAEITY